jgi:hypothetical protein
MAENAWIEVHYLAPDSTIQPRALAEAWLGSIASWDAPTPQDYRVALGIQSQIETRNGSRMLVTETYEDLTQLVKVKRKQGV